MKSVYLLASLLLGLILFSYVNYIEHIKSTPRVLPDRVLSDQELRYRACLKQHSRHTGVLTLKQMQDCEKESK